MEITGSFKTYIESQFFYIAENEKELQLIEEKGAPYIFTMKISRAASKFLIIHNLEELKKEKAKYLKQL